MSEHLLEIKGLSKSFGTNQVLFDVDFFLKRGEIHAIVGENGAGKSTMMNIIDGLVNRDGGQIFLEGEEVTINNPMDAQALGICFVHQEIALCQDVSVAQNIFMSKINATATAKRFVDYKALSEDAKKILNMIVKEGQIDPNAEVMRLSISNQQVVEIAKALSIDCKVLILDEPTAALSEAETESLYQIMHRLADQGIGIIYISHRMSEIFEQCDRVSVLRDGHMVSTYEVKDAKVQQLVNDMAGREVNAIYPDKATADAGEVLLRVSGLTDAAGRFEDIDFELKRGELLGFSGLIGSGRSEIMQGVTGLRRVSAGKVEFLGQNLIGKSTKDIFESGLMYMSEDRKQSGLFLEMSIMYNISAMHLGQITHRGLVSAPEERVQAVRMSTEMNVRSTGVDQYVLDLSGGNQQKVLVAKLLSKRPIVVILDEPTRGIDVAAKAEIHRLLRRLVEEGIGVIIVSSELNEVIGMCDRVMVVNEGRIVGEAVGDDINSNHIMYYASGAFKMDESVQGGMAQ